MSPPVISSTVNNIPPDLVRDGSLPVSILYGSQTGRARELAELLACQADQINKLLSTSYSNNSDIHCRSTVNLCCMNDYKPISRLTKEPGFILFVCSTTGYGVPPDNMLLFWRRLMNRTLIPGRSLPPTLYFAVLGLGDSSYPNFNFVAKKLYRRLTQLGATPLDFCSPSNKGVVSTLSETALGLADDQAELGINSELSWWLPLLWQSIIKLLGLTPSEEIIQLFSWNYVSTPQFVSSLWPKYVINNIDPLCITKLSLCEDLHSKISELISTQWKYTIPSNTHVFSIVQNKRITSKDHFQDTRLIEINFTAEQNVSNESDFFRPGDVLFIQPQNRLDDVLNLFDLTHTNPNQCITISQRSSIFPLPDLISNLNQKDHGLSLIWLAANYFDLNQTPQQSFFINLSAFAQEVLKTNKTLENKDRLQLEVERLKELASVDSVDTIEDLYDYVFRPNRRLIEILADFPITTSFLSSDHWFDVLPGPIRPRPYSIASAPPKLELLVAVVNYQTRIFTPRVGLASYYLASLNPGDHVIGWFGKNVSGGFQFDNLQTNPKIPCLLIAAGTGIAPFRSFLQYQHNIMKNTCEKTNDPKYILFFGCRFSNKDYYFSSELKQWHNEGWLKVINAFSREQNSIPTKIGRIYVQDQIRYNSDLVWSVLKDPNSYIYVVGNTKTMPNEVKQSLIYALGNVGHLNENDAELWISEMENHNRIQIEAWS